MESTKRRMLDPGVIRGKETERGKRRECSWKRRLEKSQKKEKKHYCHATRLQLICFAVLARHMKLIGVYFSPRVQWVLMCHTLPDGCTTSQPFSHSPSFSPHKDEDTHTKKKAWRACFFKTHPLMKYAYGSSANYGQLNFHKAKKKKREREGA